MYLFEKNKCQLPERSLQTKAQKEPKMWTICQREPKMWKICQTIKNVNNLPNKKNVNNLQNYFDWHLGAATSLRNEVNWLRENKEKVLNGRIHYQLAKLNA